MAQSFQFKPANDSDFKFQPCQIVCLEHNSVRLYAEVVQMAEGRQVCWVRPLALIDSNGDWTEDSLQVNPSRIHDLRQSSDLLLPAALFRNALDTEVIPLIGQRPELINLLHKEVEHFQAQLRDLIKSVCSAHPELF